MTDRRTTIFGLTAIVGLAGCIAASDNRPSDKPNENEKLGTVSSAIIKGSASPSTDDHVVYVVRARFDSPDNPGAKEVGDSCAGTLIAPNLVMTAKHCVYAYKKLSMICDASGEPQAGSPGGNVDQAYFPNDILIYAGAGGRRRYVTEGLTETPGARGKQIIDDGTKTMCSHDIAFLVLDRDLTEAPQLDASVKPLTPAPLRLGPRPTTGGKVSIAGWGRTETSVGVLDRIRVKDVGILGVGPPFQTGVSGNLSVRTFETLAGGCTGDSGTSAFDEQTHAALGVLSYAINMVTLPNGQASCAEEGVRNAFLTVADFPSVVREAFKAAGTEPWLEGRDARGYLKYGDACSSSLECADNKCAGLSETVLTGTCNIACTEAGRVCPEGLVCGAASGACETPAPPPPPPPATTTVPTDQPPPAAPPVVEEPETVTASGTGCAVARPESGQKDAGYRTVLALIACVALGRRIRMKRRSR